MDDIQERRKSLATTSSPPVQQFATFKVAEPYTHIPTPALEPSDQRDQHTSLSVPSTRNPQPSLVRPVAKRDRSVDIFEKHALTKPRVDDDGQSFTFKTGAAAEFEKPVLQQEVVQLKLALPRNRSRGALNLMSPEDVVRPEAKMKVDMEEKERSRERGEAERILMGNVQRSSSPRSSPLPSPRGKGIWGLAQRARERSRSGSRNRWEEREEVIEGKQKRRSLTVMTGTLEEEEEEEENPRTGRLGSRF